MITGRSNTCIRLRYQNLCQVTAGTRTVSLQKGLRQRLKMLEGAHVLNRLNGSIVTLEPQDPKQYRLNLGLKYVHHGSPLGPKHVLLKYLSLQGPKGQGQTEIR